MNQRFYSLDVFRGATVALMILVNNPGSWSHIYAPLEHAPWHGATPTDLVFPFFLFAVGNALAFVMPKLEAAGEGIFWRKILKRTFLIFAAGWALISPMGAYADDEASVKTEKGLRFAVPEDWPIEEHGGALAPISVEEYVARKFKAIETRLEIIESGLSQKSGDIKSSSSAIKMRALISPAGHTGSQG